MASCGILLQIKPIIMVFQRTVVGRGIVSNSWRAKLGWPCWHILLKRERIVGVLSSGSGSGRERGGGVVVCGGGKVIGGDVGG